MRCRPEERRAALRRIAMRIGRQPSGAGNLTQRLNACVHLLNEMNYQARWEARSSGPRLVFSHCPYATILPSNTLSFASWIQTCWRSCWTHLSHKLPGWLPAARGARVCISLRINRKEEYTVGKVVSSPNQSKNFTRYYHLTLSTAIVRRLSANS